MRCENVGNLVTSFPKKNADTFDLPGNDIFLIIVSDASFFFFACQISYRIFIAFLPRERMPTNKVGRFSGSDFLTIWWKIRNPLDDAPKRHSLRRRFFFLFLLRTGPYFLFKLFKR